MKLSHLTTTQKCLIFCNIICSLNLNAGDFTLASWNILAQWAYQSFSQEKMPFEDRMKLLLHNLKKLSEKKTDILCLQEVDMQKDHEGPEIKHCLENLGYTVIAPENPYGQETIIAYDNKKFTGTNPDVITLLNATGGGKKLCSLVTLSHLENKNLPSIKIINLHLPFEPKDTETNACNNLNKNVLTHINDNGFTILCGDFNYTTYSSNPDEKTLSYEKLVDQKYFYDAGLQHNFNKIGTAYSRAFQRMDYVLYSTAPCQQYQLICNKYAQVPRDLNRLIKHTQPRVFEGAHYSDFPSDHALLITEFKIK